MEKANRKTPLYDAHVKAGGKIIDFHGWLLPVQYSSILKEHENVRTKAGLFDVSHMGEIEVSGSDAFTFLQKMLTNDITAKPGRAIYSPMCLPDGGTVDDLIVYKQIDGGYLLVVNASNTNKDLQWLQENRTGGVDINDRSDEYAQIALQGPLSEKILRSAMTDEDAEKILSGLRFFRYVDGIYIGNAKVMLSRTGYTGEDGFELYCRPEDAQMIWDMLCDKGRHTGWSLPDLEQGIRFVSKQACRFMDRNFRRPYPLSWQDSPGSSNRVREASSGEKPWSARSTVKQDKGWSDSR